jgi:plastocyanin
MQTGFGLAAGLVAVFLGSSSAGVVGDDPGEDEPEGGPGVVVEGTVTYDGPLLDPIRVDEAGAERHPIEVDPETNGLKDAVVWLDGVSDAEGAGRPAERAPAVMDQVNYFFVPHVLAVGAGRPVEFRNSDIANHGVTGSSLEDANRFNVTTPPGGSYTHRFEASRYPVAIGCPIHAAMAAWVYVFDHPYHAVTDEEGSFRIPAVPPGRYTLHVRHADGGMGERREVAVGPDGPLRVGVAFEEDDLRAGERAGSVR